MKPVIDNAVVKAIESGDKDKFRELMNRKPQSTPKTKI